MAMHNELWFPSVIWSSVVNNVDNIALKKFAYDKIKEDDKGRVISNNKGYQSVDLRPKEHSEIDRFVQILDKEIAEISMQVGLRMPKLYNIWINVNYPGSSNNLHHHINVRFFIKIVIKSYKGMRQTPINLLNLHQITKF